MTDHVVLTAVFGWDRVPSQVLVHYLFSDLSILRRPHRFCIQQLHSYIATFPALVHSALHSVPLTPGYTTSTWPLVKMSKNVLMNEYKALAQEKWVEIEVSFPLPGTSS